jgi:hypothetical protein
MAIAASGCWGHAAVTPSVRSFILVRAELCVGSVGHVTRRRRWSLATVAVLAVALVGGGFVRWQYPLRFGATARVSVYELNEEISGPTSSPPGVLDRLTGMCDADSYYVGDGDRHYCLVLNGPLPAGAEVRVRSRDGLVVIPAESVATLRTLASGLAPPSSAAGTHLVLFDGEPVAVLPVSALKANGELRIEPFAALCTRSATDVVWPDAPSGPAGRPHCA